MNMLQMAPFTHVNGSTRVDSQFGSNRARVSEPVHEGKEGFSKMFERSCRAESSTKEKAKANARDSVRRSSLKDTSKSDPDTPSRSITEDRNDSQGDSKIDVKDKAKAEDASTDKSMAEKSAADKSATEKPVEDKSVTESPAIDQTTGDPDPSLKLELLSQLLEILQALGITVPKEGNADITNVTRDGGQDGQSQAAATLNLNPLTLDQNQLRQILSQLIDVLNSQGNAPKNLNELKMLAESGPGTTNQVPATEFLGKLVEAAKQAAQSNAQPPKQAETAAIVPLVTVVAKSAQEAERPVGVNAEKTDTAPDTLPKEANVTTGNSTENAQNSSKRNSNGDFNTNTDDNSKDSKLVSSGLKSANGNSQSSSISHSSAGSAVRAEFSIQPEVQANGQLPGQPSQTGAVQMPRMTQLIFGQIAQKARLVVAPGTTEMQIQLKPDFLGKLNLNISSDNGRVTAKFTAESHAVKGIIEANLNTLKDALAQQGVKVDQLIVDVGTQNHQSGFENRQSFYGNGQSRRNQVPMNSQEVEKLFSTEVQEGLIRDYYGSTVEYTA